MPCARGRRIRRRSSSSPPPSRPAASLAILFACACPFVPSALGRTEQRGQALAPTAIDPTLAWKRVVVGPGYVENTARQVIRTTDDRVYIFAADDTGQRLNTGPGVVRAWKANTTGIPTGFSEVDAANHLVAAGGTGHVIDGVDARLDRSGIAQLIYVDETNGNLYYRMFSTLTDTWGQPSVIATGVYYNYYLIKRSRNSDALKLDSADNLHVVYDSGTSLYYINRINGNWSLSVGDASGKGHVGTVSGTSWGGGRWRSRSVRVGWCTACMRIRVRVVRWGRCGWGRSRTRLVRRGWG